jgi:hypothetical protein
MRSIFDEAMGASPVSTIDVDTVVVRGRRRVTRRRVAGAGAVVATGVAAALALAMYGPAGSPSPPDFGVGSASPPDGSAPVRDSETPEQIKQRLASALVDGLTAALPGVRISDGPTGEPGVVVFHDPAASPRRFDADTVITTTADDDEVFFESWPGGSMPADQATDQPPGERPAPVPVTWIESCADLPAPYQNCEALVGPGGQRIVVLSIRMTEGAQGEPGAGGPGAGPTDGSAPGAVTFHEVYVTWTNARVHLAVASDTKRGEPDAVAEPPMLSREQLVAIAIDPDLTVTS